MISSVAEPKQVTVDNLGKIDGLSTKNTDILNDGSFSYYLVPSNDIPEFEVEVSYCVRTLDKTLSLGYTEAKVTKVAKIKFPNAFEANKKYNLILSIGLNTVKFSAEVSDWASDTEAVTTTVNVPEVLK